MTKFKVGDKVRILDVKSIDFGRKFWLNGDVTKVTDVEVDGGVYLATPCSKGRGLYVTKAELRYIDLVPHSSTKNQRITALESEVAELKAKVEALEKAQLSGPGTVYLHGKPIGKIDAIAALSKSPNEQRKAIIAEAKAFVEKYSGVVPHNSTPYTTEAGDTLVKLFVNKDKRIVTAIPRLVHARFDAHSDKKFAKCAPDDVFNADIGKAIALGRALGLDVSRFEQAVKPTEIIAGMRVKYADDKPTYGGETRKVTKVVGAKLYYSNGGNFRLDLRDPAPVIIDDTEAVY